MSSPGISRRKTGVSSRRLRMSDSTASAIPGYWTLTASSSPSCERARWTWPMLAAAAGSGSISASTLSGGSTPLALEHLVHLLPRDRRDVVAKRREPLLQVLGLVGVEAGELDRRQDLPGLHRRPAHDRELVDQ